VAVAETKSFSRAARRLNLSQPPLSAQIHSLEDEIGARLFDRSSKGASLTEIGRTFLTKAREILAAAQQATQLAKLPNREQPELRVGMITPSLTAKFAARLRAFRLAHPTQGIRLRHGSVDSLQRLLRTGAVDVIFTRPFHAEPQVMQRHLEWHEQLLAIPRGHPWAARSGIPWSLLKGARVLLIDPEFNALYGQNFLHMCGLHRTTPEVDYAASDLTSLIWLVAAGRGVCPYPSSLVETAPKGIVFRPFSPASRPIELVLMWSAKNESPILHAFIEMLDTAPHVTGSKSAPSVD
jgi:DNA-binding transcriptional LysR family regulator